MSSNLRCVRPRGQWQQIDFPRGAAGSVNTLIEISVLSLSGVESCTKASQVLFSNVCKIGDGHRICQWLFKVTRVLSYLNVLEFRSQTMHCLRHMHPTSPQRMWTLPCSLLNV